MLVFSGGEPSKPSDLTSPDCNVRIHPEKCSLAKMGNTSSDASCPSQDASSSPPVEDPNLKTFI